MAKQMTFSQRVLAQTSAKIGLGIISFLLLFCFLGPFMWRVDPLMINTESPLLPPTGAREIKSLTELFDLTAVDTAPLTQLSSLTEATTQQVVIGIYLEQGETAALYRHILPPTGEQDLGLPLANYQAQQSQNWIYSDQLLLQARPYFYSVVIVNPAGNSSRQTLALDVSLAQLATETNYNSSVQAHPFGTDKLGRDMLARVMAGGQISLLIAFSAPLLYVALGALYGAIAGFYGNTVDATLMAAADFVIALPFLLFVILLRVLFGFDSGTGIGAIIFALAILAWPEAARVVRAQALQLRQQAFVNAAKLQGHSNFYIITRHLLPNTLPSVLVVLSFAIPSAIFTEAFLSFLGLGILPPAASWGSLCNEGVANFLSAPHVLLFPALFISLAVLGFNLLGDGLRDALEQEVQA